MGSESYKPFRDNSLLSFDENSLVNRQDASGRVYNNVLTEAAIVGLNGASWANQGLLYQLLNALN